MKYLLNLWPCLGALMLSAVTLGCASKPEPADPQVARETLRAALDAWKSGEGIEALQQVEPPILVSDHEWGGGTRLLDYQVDSKDQIFGTDLRCRVKLTLQGKNGKKRQKQATYSVGTSQALVVVREDDD
jgi:hypothetical protein